MDESIPRSCNGVPRYLTMSRLELGRDRSGGLADDFDQPHEGERKKLVVVQVLPPAPMCEFDRLARRIEHVAQANGILSGGHTAPPPPA